jgi:predicted dienelactone hydrolase
MRKDRMRVQRTLVVVLVVATACSVPAQQEPSSAGSRGPAGHPSEPATPSPSTVVSRPIGASFAIGVRLVTFVDTSRSVPALHTVTGKPGPRILVTEVWYPALGAPGGAVRPGAPPSLAAGPYPLVVFAPGFDRDPSSYVPLLTAWARAGYVVAAPTFPLTNPRAVGGLDESDIVNQPGDLSFLISRLTRASQGGLGPFAGLIDPARIGVAGHSDGADAALVAADGSCCRDPRIGAVIVMAGAALPWGGRYFTRPGPPLLAIQGSADAFNPPSFTASLFREAPAPKYLLWFPGADHLQPFVGSGPLEAVVREVSVAFLDRFLGDRPRTPIRLPTDARGLASLQAVPRS